MSDKEIVKHSRLLRSMAIYRAVLEDKVESVDEFKAWLEKPHANT